MIVKFVGYLSIAWGILWVVRPEFLQNSLRWKTGWYLFGLAAGFFFFPLIHFFGKKAGLVGTFTVVLIFWIGMKMLSATLRDLFIKIPLMAFRIAGVVNILTGCALVWSRIK